VIPGRSPIRCGVATRTLRGGEGSGNVVWDSTTHSCGGVVFVLMATVAIGVGLSEVVIVIRVAVRAWSGGVRTG